MKKHLILCTLIFACASFAFAQNKPAKIEKTETPKTEAGKLKLPTAKEVFNNHVKASGGREAADKIKSRSVIGAVELPMMGLKGVFETISKRPNKNAAYINLTGFGIIVEAFDGSEAWSENPLQGRRVKTGVELDQAKKLADFDSDLKYEKTYPKAVVTGIEKIDGTDVYVVKADEETTYYFNKQNGLLARTNAVLTSPEGKINSITTFEDYRDIDGVKQPYRVRQSALGAEFIFTVSEIKQNIDIADERFSKPK